MKQFGIEVKVPLSNFFKVHSQWLSLTRSDAQIFTDTPMKYLDIVDEWAKFNPVKMDSFSTELIKDNFPIRYPELADVAIASEAALESLRNNVNLNRITEKICPDNYYIYLSLMLNDPTRKIDSSEVTSAIPPSADFIDLTDRNNPSVATFISPSPYEYKDLLTRRYNVLGDKSVYLSLLGIITLLRDIRPNVFFLRKVAKGVFDDTDYRPWSD